VGLIHFLGQDTHYIARMNSSFPGGSQDWWCYGIALIILILVAVVPFVPGTLPFFIAHSLIWGLSSFFLNLGRKRAWERVGMPDGPSWIPGWKETAPAWAFEASFLVQLVNVPFALITGLQVFASYEAFVNSATFYLTDYPAETLWIDHVVFASLNGFLWRDFFLHFSRPDPMLVIHHIGSIILMISFAFFRIPGIRLLAFTTNVTEIGTSSYCAWVIWRWGRAYWWVMNVSNIVLFTSTSLLFFWAETWTPLVVSCYSIGVGLVIGRTYVMFDELRQHAGVKKSSAE